MNDTDWLLCVQSFLDDDEPEEVNESLSFIGRLFAFAGATNTLLVAQAGGPTIGGLSTYELWFSFDSELHKQAFLQMIRDDGASDPDDECFWMRPSSLEDLINLRPLGRVFPEKFAEHITAVAAVVSMDFDDPPYLN